MLIGKNQIIVDAVDSLKNCEDWLSSIEYEIDEFEELDVSRPMRKIQEELGDLRHAIDQMDELFRTVKFIQAAAERMVQHEDNKDLEMIISKLSYWCD